MLWPVILYGAFILFFPYSLIPLVVFGVIWALARPTGN